MPMGTEFLRPWSRTEKARALAAASASFPENSIWNDIFRSGPPVRLAPIAMRLENVVMPIKLCRPIDFERIAKRYRGIKNGFPVVRTFWDGAWFLTPRPARGIEIVWEQESVR